jgi:hypothetical protein
LILLSGEKKSILIIAKGAEPAQKPVREVLWR